MSRAFSKLRYLTIWLTLPNHMPALACPICKKPVDLTSSEAPFCSPRCRTIDLGKWASGDYKISSPILDPDLLEDLAEAEQQKRPVLDPEDFPEGKFWKN